MNSFTSSYYQQIITTKVLDFPLYSPHCHHHFTLLSLHKNLLFEVLLPHSLTPTEKLKSLFSSGPIITSCSRAILNVLLAFGRLSQKFFPSCGVKPNKEERNPFLRRVKDAPRVGWGRGSEALISGTLLKVKTDCSFWWFTLLNSPLGDLRTWYTYDLVLKY